AADIGILLDITWIWLPGSCARGGEGRPVAKGVGTVRPPQTSRAPWHPVGGGSMDPGWRVPGRWRETDTSPDGTEGRAPDAGADRTDRGAGVGVRRAGPARGGRCRRARRGRRRLPRDGAARADG